MRYILSTLMVASLIGCAHQSVEINVTASTPVERTTVSPKNPRMGFITRGANTGNVVVVQLVREAFQGSLEVNSYMVARNRSLAPTALLKILEIRGLAARVAILHGQPGPEDEVVLPSPALREAAEALPLVKTDT